MFILKKFLSARSLQSAPAFTPSRPRKSCYGVSIKKKKHTGAQFMLLGVLSFSFSAFLFPDPSCSLFETAPLVSYAAAASIYYPEEKENPTSEPGWALSELATRTDNSDEAPVFSGGEIRFLANTATDQQQLCGIFRSSDGRVLVVDGGVAENAPRLLSVLKEFGGRVDAWLITHPQDDHVGALDEILRNHAGEVDIQNVYFHFNETEWYAETAPEDVPAVTSLLEALKTLPAERLHGFTESSRNKSRRYAKSPLPEDNANLTDGAGTDADQAASPSVAEASASSNAPAIIRTYEQSSADNAASYPAPIGQGDVISLSSCLSFRVMNDPLRTTGSYAVNNSSIMYDIEMDGKHIIVLGDMGPDSGDLLLPNLLLTKPQADYVVMAHHGQNGVKENFYRALNPKACIWSSPEWLFNAAPTHRKLKTSDTKSWINAMGITKNYCTKDGDVILR